MIKVVYNACYGGFGLSEKAVVMINKIKSKDNKSYDWDCPTNRADLDLISVITKLGFEESSAKLAKLKIREIPGCLYRIDEYDGYESVECPEDEQGWILVDCPEARERFPEMFL